ncbi:unnamed protein product [Amoebophrya sp. A25]|nr:unnamed protein product [Amoebophrya sp. A25]|eukprot:GSA25T00017996001.1
MLLFSILLSSIISRCFAFLTFVSMDWLLHVVFRLFCGFCVHHILFLRPSSALVLRHVSHTFCQSCNVTIIITIVLLITQSKKGYRREQLIGLSSNNHLHKMAKMMMAKMSSMKMAMKMKMMSAMKMGMKKMAMKKSVIAKGKRAKSSVFKGTKEKTSGGLKKSDLKKNKAGKIVSSKKSAAAKKSKQAKTILAWAAAVVKARKALGIKGFCPIGGKTAAGKALYAKVKSFAK